MPTFNIRIPAGAGSPEHWVKVSDGPLAGPAYGQPAALRMKGPSGWLSHVFPSPSATPLKLDVFGWEDLLYLGVNESNPQPGDVIHLYGGEFVRSSVIGYQYVRRYADPQLTSVHYADFDHMYDTGPDGLAELSTVQLTSAQYWTGGTPTEYRYSSAYRELTLNLDDAWCAAHAAGFTRGRLDFTIVAQQQWYKLGTGSGGSPGDLLGDLDLSTMTYSFAGFTAMPVVPIAVFQLPIHLPIRPWESVYLLDSTRPPYPALTETAPYLQVNGYTIGVASIDLVLLS